MTILHAILLGLVEGITEFLPVSSTGHMVLTSTLLHIPETDFLKIFEVIVQLGAILAVAVLYIKKLFSNKKLFLSVVYGFIPTAILGLLLYKKIKILMGSPWVVIFSLFIGGFIILAVEKYIAKKHMAKAESDTHTHAISNKEAGLLGVIQSIAFIPGVSRSGALIIGGLLRGIPRKTIVEFSFLLALPTMAAATGLEVLKNGFTFTAYEYLLLCVGFITAFITAYIAIKTFLRYISTHNFTTFGWYRIGIAVVMAIILLN
ncbi:MAG: undecaprenyl-diphosphate phosphatase [Minisyncoccia bacterium]